MADAFNEADDFLMANYRIGLEEVLCDGCFTGRLSIVLADAATIAADLTQATIEEDGGRSHAYVGVLTLNGLAYRFRCSVFIDTSGQRFLSDVAEFAPAGAEGSAPPRRFVRN